MKRYAVAVALLLCGAAQANPVGEWLTSKGIEVEGGIGNTKWTPPPNSQYWQNFDDGIHGKHSFDMNSPSYYIGFTGMLDTPTWLPPTRWRVGYQYLGNVQITAKATSDTHYNGVNNCITTCPTDPLSWATFNTEGSTRGFKLTLAPEWHIGGGFKAFVEAGAFIHLPKVDVKIDRCCGHTEDYYYHYKSGWNAGPTVGFGVGHDKTELVLSWYQVDAVNRERNLDSNIPPNWGSNLRDTFNVSMRHRF